MELDPALLSAVLSAPHDDEPRRVAADWFDDRGETARAAFIRHQLRIAEGPRDDRDVVRAQRHAGDLLKAHGHRWLGVAPRIPLLEWGGMGRGFVDTVRVYSVGALFEHAATIWAHHPIDTVELRPRVALKAAWAPEILPVRKLRVISGELDPNPEITEPEISALHLLLAHIEELEVVIWDEWDDGYWNVLGEVSMPALRVLRVRGHHTSATIYARRAVEAGFQLHTLDLGTDFVDYDSGYFDDPTLGTGGARLLAAAPGLAGLRHLNLDLQRIDTVGLAEVLGSFTELRSLSARRTELRTLPTLPDGAPLEHLALGTNDLDVEEGGFLSHPRTSGLRVLDLSSNGLDAEHVSHIVEAPCWSTLRELDLSGNGLTGCGERFAAAPPPGRLHTLRLGESQLGYQDVRAIVARDWVRTLERLDLRGASAAKGALGRLAESRIAELGLADTQLEADALRALLPGLRHCEQLDLSHNERVGSALPALLADAPELRSLELRGVSLQGVVDRQLGRGAPRVVRLGLAATGLGDDGLADLLRSPLGERLVDLDLSNCGLGPRAIEALVAWPRLNSLHRLVLHDNREIGEEEVVRLARAVTSPHARIRLPGYRWRFSAETNAVLQQHLGPHWDEDFEDVAES